MTSPRPTRRLSLAIATLIGFTMSDSPLPAANYDEAKVPKYELPDPLTMQDGTKVKSASDWVEKRRPEVLEFGNLVKGSMRDVLRGAQPAIIPPSRRPQP